MLIGLMLNAVFGAASISGAVVTDDTTKEARMAAKLKLELQKTGVGKDSKIEVKLHDGTKISGYLSEINEEDFVVTTQNDDPRTIRYDNVRRARGRHRYHRYALSTSILGLALGVLVLALSRGERY